MAEHSGRFFARLADMYLVMNEMSIKKYEGEYVGADFKKVSKQHAMLVAQLEDFLDKNGYHVGRVYSLQGLLTQSVQGDLLSASDKNDVKVRRKAYVLNLGSRIADEMSKSYLHK